MTHTATTATRTWLVRLPSGDIAAINCTEEQADRGEDDGLWEVVGSGVRMTLSEARREGSVMA